MKLVLELQGQRSGIQKVTVRHDIVIGRASDCNLRIAAPQVSRRHCFLRVGDDGVAITDLESSNGTWLDGERTVPGKRYPVGDGMKISVGPVRFVARFREETPVVEVVPTDSSDSVVPVAPAYGTPLPPNPPESGSMDFFSESDDPVMLEEATEGYTSPDVVVEVISAGPRSERNMAGIGVISDDELTVLEEISSAEVVAVQRVESGEGADDIIELELVESDPDLPKQQSAESPSPDSDDLEPPADGAWFNTSGGTDPELRDFLRRNS